MVEREFSPSQKESIEILQSARKIEGIIFSDDGLLLDANGNVHADKMRKWPDVIMHPIYPVPNRDEDFDTGESEKMLQGED